MITASQLHNDVMFYGAVGATLRMIVDFNSYQTQGMSKEDFVDAVASNYSGWVGIPSKEERIEKRNLTVT